jgi:Uma2 family endonuclease
VCRLADVWGDDEARGHEWQSHAWYNRLTRDREARRGHQPQIGRTPQPTTRSSRCKVLLVAQLHAWAESEGSGVAFSPSTGFRLRDGSLLCPDASCVRHLSNGARLAVLIDPGRRAVEISTTDRGPQVLESAQPVSLDPVLPGVTLDVRRIFE